MKNHAMLDMSTSQASQNCFYKDHKYRKLSIIWKASMQSQSSKIYQPTRQPKTLRRIRLLDLLHSNIHRKVTYVCAPAGYGKTTLLVDFVEDVDAEVYWFRITPEDLDFHTFIENLVR